MDKDRLNFALKCGAVTFVVGLLLTTLFDNVARYCTF